MSKTSISQFSTSAASNTDINGINVNTGWPPSNVGPAFRTLMALLADVCQGVQTWVTVVATAGIKSSGNDAGAFAFRATNGNYGVGLQNNGTSAFLLQTAAGDPDGAANAFRPFTWDLASGAVTIDGTGQGATFGGGVTATDVKASAGGGQGGARLARGSGGRPGNLSVLNSAGTEVGFAGFSDGLTSLVLGASGGFTGWRVPGTFIVDGVTNLIGATNLVGGNSAPISSLTNGWSFLTGGTAAGYSQSGTPLALGSGILSGNVLSFFFGNTPTGSVANNGSGTGVVYNNTSDGRLKIKRGRITNSGSIIDRIAALWFNWKANPDAEPEPGFFAQQLHRVCPWMVTKGKGRPGSKGFVPWQIDKSALLPVLVAELQDVRRRLAALEAAQ